MNTNNGSTPGAAITVRGVGKSFGTTPVLHDVDLHVEAGTTVALLGPSGCGKTTLLRIIAGLERADAGEIDIGGQMVAGPGTHVPPERRQVGMVFQDWALFPHLDVAANVGYGLPRRERRAGRVERALEMVGLEGFTDRMPGTLSGGQQQRVALARALAPEPAALLLDEPFSNLDTQLRAEVRAEVRDLLAELRITAAFVTHDQDEAFVLGDEVAVIERGDLIQQATPAELYTHPATPWVASFVGDANLLTAAATGDRATCAVGTIALAQPADGAGRVLIRPEDLLLGDGDTADVQQVEYYGHDCLYSVRLADGEVVSIRAMSAPRFAIGDRVGVTYSGGPTVAFVG